MTLKISCKHIKENAFDITVGKETQTITHDNNHAVFKLSESKNYNIEISKKPCKSNHSFGSILIFFFTMILQGIFNILLMNTDSKWYNKLSPYVIKTNFNVFIDKDTDLEFTYNEGYFYSDTKTQKLPTINCDNITPLKTEYSIDKVNLTNAYCKYVKKFISCASVCELIFLLLILLAAFNNNFTAAVICCILFALVIILQIFVFIKEFKRLKKIVKAL